jgi:DNA-binding GntR family transcriptional regulator
MGNTSHAVLNGKGQDMQQDKLEHLKLNDRTYAALKGGLISGAFQPGQVLVIRAVAQRYGISPTPVREALQRLVAERLLTMQPNRSIVVPALSVEKFSELYRIRCALEGLAGELATDKLRAADLTKLGKTIDAMEKTVTRRDSAAYRELNEKFHFLIYAKAASPRLLEMIENLWCQAGPFLYGLFEDPDYGPHANDHHRQILEALERRDAQGVRDRLAEDITAAAHSLIPRLKSLVVHGREVAAGESAEEEASEGASTALPLDASAQPATKPAAASRTRRAR